jgi:hypothetical protein
MTVVIVGYGSIGHNPIFPEHERAVLSGIVLLPTYAEAARRCSQDLYTLAFEPWKAKMAEHVV